MYVMFGEGESRSGTVNGAVIPDGPDLARMRAERGARLRAEMQRRVVEALLILGTSNVHYATGAAMPSVDGARATRIRPVALVLDDDPEPHLFTPYPDGAAGRIAADHVYPPLLVDVDESAPDIAKAVLDIAGPDRRLASDEFTYPLLDALDGGEVGNGSAILGASRIVKTVDELACTRATQRINEAAMTEVYPEVRPGVRQSQLTGMFLEAVFDRGATGVAIDTIWQVMPTSRAEGPWTVHGDVAYPTAGGDRVLAEGDVMWVDSGVLYEGYPSDYGRTWIVGQEPRAAQHSQFERWCNVMRSSLSILAPGVTGAELCQHARAADAGASDEAPWLDHFYLSHGIGVDSAEMPLIGTDLGERFDASLVLQPGMTVVLEPVIWEDGIGGYRSEEIFVVADDGWIALSGASYAPFGDVA